MKAPSLQSKRILAIVLVAGAAILTVFLAGSIVTRPAEGAERISAAATEPAPPSPDAPAMSAVLGSGPKPPAGLDSVLYQVENVCRAEDVGSALSFAATTGLAVDGDAIRVLVQVEPGEAAVARSSILANGGRRLSSFSDSVVASVPPDRFCSLFEGGGVLRMAPDLPLSDDSHPLEASSLTPVASMMPASSLTPAGEIVSEGVAETNADAWHTGGYRGRGVKIGIIDFGFSGYQSLLGSELPSAVNVWGKSPAGPESEGLDHGTMVAEVIHDMAPEADLFLARIWTITDFEAARVWLLSQGVQVINHSAGWHLSGLLDGGGNINASVTDAVGKGVFWAGTAANQRKRHWMGDFTDPDGDGWLNWDGEGAAQVIWADAGKTVSGFLAWEDSWNGAAQDYDLYLYRWDGHEYVYEMGSRNRQDGTSAAAWPTEKIVFTAPTSAAYAWFIWRDSATRTDVDFDFHSYDNDLDDGYSYSYFDYERSIVIPADNRSSGFMAAAAIGRAPTYAQDDYSSEGPTRDGRLAPEIAAPNDIQTSLGRFWGTSCAAPHLAGAAALVLQAYPDYSPAQVEDYLRGHAIDLGIPGPDNQYGYGRLHLGDPPFSQGNFSDVPASHPYNSAISGMAARGIISGYDDGSFGPDKQVMRQQFAKMIVRALQLPVSTADICPFTDVSSGVDPKDPLYPNNYVAVCSAHGITQGAKTAGTFAPYANISRAQVVTMVVRALDRLRPGLLVVPSAGYTATLGNFSPDHAGNMAKAEYNGLLADLAGFGTSWDVWRSATRGEVAQLLWSALAL